MKEYLQGFYLAEIYFHSVNLGALIKFALFLKNCEPA